MAEHTTQIDDIVTYVEGLLDEMRDHRKEISDRKLQYLALRLPTLMYRAGSLVDRAAIEADVAKAARELVYAAHYQNAEGTIPERQSEAELKTAEETLIVNLSKHVYARVKAKLENADKLFDGIRKVMTNRDNEKAVFRKDKS